MDDLTPSGHAPFPVDFDGRLEYPSCHGQRSVTVRCHRSGAGFTFRLPEIDQAVDHLGGASVVLTAHELGHGPTSVLIGYCHALADDQIDTGSLLALEDSTEGIHGRYFVITSTCAKVDAVPPDVVPDVPVAVGATARRSESPELHDQPVSANGRLAGTSRSDPERAVVTVFIVDDQEIVRRGLADLIGTHPRLKVVGEAGLVREATRRIPAVRPDVALLDVRLPDGSGVEVCREIRTQVPETRCLMLTSFDDDDALFAAVMAGAAGYLMKEIRGSSLTNAIEQIADGRSLIDPSLTDRLLRRLCDPATSEERDDLTAREHEILVLITEGLTNRQIGERLFLAEKTVKHYVSGLLAKLGMQRRTQIAAYGAQLADSRQTRRRRYQQPTACRT
ncbi:MAG TPA: response regulator transcription factor [Microlunatus sp.]|nr:response regulator transcription factor [Microlunatus sp.]